MGLKVGVLGAGAVGCYVGGRLAATSAVDVRFVGRAALREATAANGLTAIDLEGSSVNVEAPDVTENADSLADRDVVLVCVKSGQTDEVADKLAAIARKDAVIVSLQNGVQNVRRLRDKIPERTVLAGIVAFNVITSDFSTFRQTTKGGLLIESQRPPAIAKLRRALSLAHIETSWHDDLKPHQWTKLLVNLNNAVSALSGAPTPRLILDAGYRRIVHALMKEALGVLRTAGTPTAPLRGAPIGLLVGALSLPTPLVRLVARAQLKADPDARSSMWSDLSRRRPTEIDDLNAEIVRLAKAHGARAPLNERIVALVREAEERNEGPPNLSADALWSALSSR